MKSVLKCIISIATIALTATSSYAMDWSSSSRSQTEDQEVVYLKILNIRNPQVRTIHHGYRPLHRDSAGDFCKQIRERGARYDQYEVKQSDRVQGRLAWYNNRQWESNENGMVVYEIECKESAPYCH